MKRIVIIVLMLVIGMFLFSSCSNKNIYEEQYIYNAIIGDCISESVLPEIILQLENLNWLDYNINLDEKPTYIQYSKLIYKNSEIDSLTTKDFTTWIISIKDNKLIATNQAKTYIGLYNEFKGSEYIFKDLSTNRQDTSFWNVIDVLKKYCSVRDTIKIGTIIIKSDGRW